MSNDKTYPPIVMGFDTAEDLGVMVARVFEQMEDLKHGFITLESLDHEMHPNSQHQHMVKVDWGDYL